jgi:hypothetical protein
MESVAFTVVPSVVLSATGAGNSFLPAGARRKPTFLGLRLLLTMMLIAMRVLLSNVGGGRQKDYEVPEYTRLVIQS